MKQYFFSPASVFFYIVFLLSSNDSHALVLKLKGKIIDNSANVTKISLYKWNNVFDSQLITELVIGQNNEFYLAIEVNEIDVYHIRNSSNNKYIQFIWDGDIELTVKKSDDFHVAVIQNSPLSLEWVKYDELIQNTYFEPIRVQDELLNRSKQLPIKNEHKIDSLQKVRTLLIEMAQKNIMREMYEYVKTHTHSFLSLVLLTSYVNFDSDGLENKRYFELLDKKLKLHSRASVFKN